MRTDWKSYFVFTRRERVGIVILVVLIVMVAVLPLFFSEHKNDNDKLEWEKYQRALAMAEDRNDKGSVEDSVNEIHDGDRRNFSENKEEFLFDPNTLSEEGWKRLGIRDRTIQTIHRFVDKGGRFREPEDLGKIYGISKKDYERLVPFVRINRGSHYTNERSDNPKHFAVREEYSEKSTYEKRGFDEDHLWKKARPTVIEINSADSVTLMSLPGIGRVLASRIIRFRERLGGYYVVDQLKEIYGMSDSTFRSIRAAFVCNQAEIKKINLNHCEQEQLSKHPYIQWKLAAAIIQYRNQHGPYNNPSDLIKIETLTADKIQKLQPYLTID
jgi:competence protein ComEA